MPWKSEIVNIRLQLVLDRKNGYSVTALAEMYDVDRKTVRKWLDRFETEGVAGLADRVPGAPPPKRISGRFN